LGLLEKIGFVSPNALDRIAAFAPGLGHAERTHRGRSAGPGGLWKYGASSTSSSCGRPAGGPHAPIARRIVVSQ
jgi:hypothetical protein